MVFPIGFHSFKVNRVRFSSSESLLPDKPPVSLQAAVASRKISLDSTEVQLFQLMRDVCRDLGLNTTLRVAGGWVRDKLLGLPSTDIDIALDDISGEKFAALLVEWASSKNNGTATSEPQTVRANPEQSKHLETTIIRLLDKEIDFSRLRTDTYASDNRIPTIRAATAREDALRRDLTINSLFYNINTDSVEDWSGRGLSDLQAGRIVTPLDPKVTLADDPLRALRTIRFSSRYGFKLDPTLFAALHSFDCNLLIHKVSRDRIGIELRKMLTAATSKQVIDAMRIITEVKLYNVVFQESHSVSWPAAAAAEGLRRLELMCRCLEEDPVLKEEVSRDELLAIFVLAYVSPVLPENSGARRGSSEVDRFLYTLFKSTLRFSSRSADVAVHFLSSAKRAISMLDSVLSKAPHASSSSIQRVLSVYWRANFSDQVSTDPFAALADAPAIWIYQSGHLWPLVLCFSRCLRPAGLKSFSNSMCAIVPSWSVYFRLIAL